MIKSNLRKIYLARQKSLSPIERKRASEKITQLFFDNFDLNEIHFLHCFLSIEKFNEIETHLIFERIWLDFPHLETLVPRVNFATQKIENLKFSPEIELLENHWQIREPFHGELIETSKIDLVLVPLLCFDEKGFRVGYGKGFYDKFLIKCRADCLKIGLSFFPQVEKIADAWKFDVRLDCCITPETVFKSFK